MNSLTGFQASKLAILAVVIVQFFTASMTVATEPPQEFAAWLPKATSQPLDGNVAVDDKAGYFAEILAYESLSDNAATIATSISGKLTGVNRVFLVKQPDYLQGALQLKEIEDRLKTFSAMFDDLHARYPVTDGAIGVDKGLPLAALAAIPAVVGALADVAAMFRVDRSIKGRQTAVSDDSLMFEVAKALRETGKAPELEIIRPSFNTKPNPAIVAMLQNVREKADNATFRHAEIRTALATATNSLESINGRIAVTVAEITAIVAHYDGERKDVKHEIKRLKGLFEQVPVEKPDERRRLTDAIQKEEDNLTSLKSEEDVKVQQLRAKLESLDDSLDAPKYQRAIGDVAVAQFEAVLMAFSEFTSKLISIPVGGTDSPLANLAETCVLRDCPPGSLILTVAVVGQGGEIETRKSIWTSGRVYHRVGTACHYALFANDGRLIDSGMVVANRQAKEGKRINVRK